MPSTQFEGFRYPTHFLKSRGSVIMNNFRENRTKQATRFARRIDSYALFDTNNEKHILNRNIRAPVVTRRKSIKKIEKSPIFESLPFL